MEPGKETQVRIPPAMAMMQQMQRQVQSANACKDYHVVAAIFADGTVSGDLQWINAIVRERRKAYQDLAKAIDILNKATGNEADQASVVQQLTEWKNTEQPQVRQGRVFANYGETSGWSGSTTGPPVGRPLTRDAVPGATVWLVREKGKSLPEAVKLLTEWRDRLSELKPVTQAGEPNPPQPLSRREPFRGPESEPQPDLVGKPAPEFNLKDVDGREVALKELRGKTVLLDFWATWCEPCRKDVPEIKALYEEFKDQGLVVVCIDFSEPAETARKYFADEKLPFTNLLDPNKETFKKYGAGGIPKVVLIDGDGMVRYFQQGRRSNQDFHAEVTKLGLAAQR
jgi:peroxiredoxin